MVRVVSVLICILVLAACSSDGPTNFTGPSQTLPSQVLPSPVPPSPIPPSTPPPGSGSSLLAKVLKGPFSLTGFVTDAVTGRSLAADFVDIMVDQRNGLIYSYTWARGPVFADASGRFELTELPESVVAHVYVGRARYVQQCAISPIVTAENTTVDVPLVPEERISSSFSYTPDPPGFRTVSGTVFTATAEGRQPLAGAGVFYEATPDSTAARTITDADGRYLLCGIPADRQASIFVYGPGYGYAVATAGATELDIEVR